MHDHATDAGLAAFHGTTSARELRLHLDNAHDYMTSGWTWDRMVERHEALHAVEDVRLAKLGAAADLIAERLAEAPAAVVESILGDRLMHLFDANDTLYLAEEVDPRHMPAAGPLYRLTKLTPLADACDIVAATKASIAATRTYLDAHKASEAIPSEAPGEESGSADRRPSPGAPQSSEGADVRPAGRPAPSGVTSSGGAS